MADEIKNYSNIEIPYDDYLSRGNITAPEGSLDSNNGSVESQPVKEGGALNDIWIRNFIKSENFSPKKRGFMINGQTGYAEFMNVFISGNIRALTGTIGGFTIGTTTLSATSGGNTTTLSSGTTAFSAGPTASPTVTISQAGVITATGAIIDGTSTLGGRLASTLATAIDSSGAFINANLNTSAKTILGSFTFSGSGAIAMNTDANNGLWLSPTGMLGKKAGVNTFTIDTSGNATFAGTLSAAAGTLGTITSATITGGTIDGVTITGGTIQTSSSGLRLVMSGSNNAYEFRSGSTLLSQLKSMTIPDSGLSGAALVHGTGEILLGISGQGVGGGGRSVVMQNSTASSYFGFFDYDNGTFGVECNVTTMISGKLQIPVGSNLY